MPAGDGLDRATRTKGDPMQYAYPTAGTLMRIEQDKLPVLQPSPAMAQAFPEETEDTWAVSWDQLDNFAGLTHPRALNAAPLPVKPAGIREMTSSPGVYSDMMLIDERKMTTRRALGTFGTPVDISDLVAEGSDHLATRDFSRLDYLRYTLIQTGAYVAQDRRGVTTHQLQYTPRQYNATSWANETTATPIADIRYVQNVGGLGTDARFDSSALILMTTTKWNQLIGNQNAADLGGKRGMYGATFNDISDFNRLLLSNDLPQIKLVQDGYFDDNPANNTYNTWVKYLQDNKVVVLGKRPGNQKIGRTVMVRNVNAPSNVGRYFHINDRTIDAEGPRRIELHRGFNVAVVVEFPLAVYIINC